ncbi:hypothetical protein BLA15816_07077 [Burkholderia lata]|nr:hypothetical protein BLA15816_07077 [Burkholderia lata]
MPLRRPASARPGAGLPAFPNRAAQAQQDEKGIVMITFKSKAAQDLDVLKDFAVYVLGLVGKQLGERGVITHDELDHAIAKLEGAVAQAKQERAEHAGHFHEDEADHAHHEVPPSLAQRVAPFLTMLREAKAGEADVHWGF